MRKRAYVRFILVTVTAIIAGSLLSLFNMRIDLTEDSRYTLSPQTRKILSELDEEIYIQVYLEGEMPVPFKKMRRSVRDILDEFRLISRRKVGYDFINPAGGADKQTRNARQLELINKGLSPVNVQAGDEEGGTTTRMIFPGMIVNYNGIEVPVNFLKNNPALPPEQNLINSIEGLEYEMIQTVATLTADTIFKVAFIEGHGELEEIEVADITLTLAKFFTIDRGVIGGKPGILDSYSAIIIAKPTEPFSEADKFVIDQYIMNGGRVLWLTEEVKVDSDSLDYGETVAVYEPTGLGDQLFRYGARINPVIIQDVECLRIPLKIVGPDNNSQFVPTPWPYFPLLVPSDNHPVTRNINRVKGEFANSVDTVGLSPDIRKRILLATSDYTRTITPPVIISLSEAGRPPGISEFNRSGIPVAVLLEGKFPSAFRNRPVPEGSEGRRLVDESVPTRMVVVADGDIIRNEVTVSSGSPVPVALGYDRYTMQTFGNRDFIVNSLNWLVDDNGLMELRSREMKLRLLNKELVKARKGAITLVNIFVPLILLGLAGYITSVLRKKRYGRS
ncbi:MAG: gliding motility-associated ABC transporter substrate-binding protein GldG [Bacteroidales bacterium]|nr:gliding motility-associated ABC transporter substrate-binding protein GldG [Bacteroidales bacterium]